MDQSTDWTLEAAQGSPGSAEFLSTLLKSANNTKCPHFPKIKPSLAAKVPHILGFFAFSNKTISWLRTDRLCYNCYVLAVPHGFIIWSTGALGEQNGPVLPSCVEAGTEGYTGRETPKPQLHPPTCMIAGHEAEEAFNWLQEQEQPFFIDFLHLSRPFNRAAANLNAEVSRVNREIQIAFDSASRCLVTQQVNDEIDLRTQAAGMRLVHLPLKSETSTSKKAKNKNKSRKSEKSTRQSIPDQLPRLQESLPAPASALSECGQNTSQKGKGRKSDKHRNHESNKDEHRRSDIDKIRDSDKDETRKSDKSKGRGLDQDKRRELDKDLRRKSDKAKSRELDKDKSRESGRDKSRESGRDKSRRSEKTSERPIPDRPLTSQRSPSAPVPNAPDTRRNRPTTRNSESSRAILPQAPIRIPQQDRTKPQARRTEPLPVQQDIQPGFQISANPVLSPPRRFPKSMASSSSNQVLFPQSSLRNPVPNRGIQMPFSHILSGNTASYGNRQTAHNVNLPMQAQQISRAPRVPPLRRRGSAQPLPDMVNRARAPHLQPGRSHGFGQASNSREQVSNPQQLKSAGPGAKTAAIGGMVAGAAVAVAAFETEEVIEEIEISHTELDVHSDTDPDVHPDTDPDTGPDTDPGEPHTDSDEPHTDSGEQYTDPDEPDSDDPSSDDQPSDEPTSDEPSIEGEDPETGDDDDGNDDDGNDDDENDRDY